MQSPPLHFLNGENEVDTSSFFSEVLLVEADPAAQRALWDALKPIVGDLYIAASAEEALRALETQFLELIILSVDLPDVAGITLLHTIEHYRPGLPIIAATKPNALEEALAAMREGAWDYIVVSDRKTLGERVGNAVRHVAERKLSQMKELDLRSERSAFWAAVQMAQDGLAIVGPSGGVTFANAAFQEFVQFLGFSPTLDEQINLIHYLMAHEKALAQQFSLVLRGQRDGDSMWSSELRVEAVDALLGPSTRHFQLNLSSINVGGFDSGPMDGRRHVLWITDITQRKEHEKFQREVISTTSHDLKGPLGAITCAAELISETGEALPPETSQMVARIHSCARKALNHIEEFLSARKIEDGVLSVDPCNFALDEFMEDIVMDYLMLARGKQLSLTYEPSEAGRECFADRLALSRVIGNLVTNAIKFTPEGGQITLQATKNGQFTKLSVCDTGTGIDPQARYTLFERYARLKEHGQVEGTGLGLYIAKNIIEAHHGRIEVESELGKGTTFHLYLPVPAGEA